LPLAEKSLIARIRRMPGAGLSGAATSGLIRLGIGDDTAILRFPAGQEVLVTTDFSLEGVHFRRDWHSPESVGHRCLARGLSDIAAMGGEPEAAFLSLALPARLPQAWVDGFLRGLLALASQYGVTLAGGDTAQSPKERILADIVVLGSVLQGKAVRRSGAKPGDAIYVTGELGASALALKKLSLSLHSGKKLNPKKYPRHFFPEPRIAVGRYLLAHAMASAMIDLSDGLSTDLHHICEESRVGAHISAELIPRAEGATLQQALHGGEDYELLFTAPAKRKIPRSIAGVPVRRIGTVVQQKRGSRTSHHVMILDHGKAAELLPRGWEHFARESSKKPKSKSQASPK
jgi:thiamine-monophosphate kinase